MEANPLFDLARSESLLPRANDVIPGGVNRPSPVGQALATSAPFMTHGEGAWINDEDGNRYADLVMGNGSLIFGHSPKPVRDAMVSAIEKGSASGASTIAEVELAEMIRSFMPTLEQIRIVTSRLDAMMSAIHLARASTKRLLVVVVGNRESSATEVKFDPARSDSKSYHSRTSLEASMGVSTNVIAVEHNDLDATEALMASRGSEIAAIVIEPVASGMGCIMPTPKFLASLRKLCDRHGTLLILDEFVTAFRVARGGCQEVLGIKADLTCVGSVIGCGSPIAAYGGRRDLMRQLAPVGEVHQPSTSFASPLAVAGGIAALRTLDATRAWRKLEYAGAYLQGGLENILDSLGIPGQVSRVGSMMSLSFSPNPCSTRTDLEAADNARFVKFLAGMLCRGVFLPTSPVEAWFLSTAHNDEVLDHILDAARSSLRDTTKP